MKTFEFGARSGLSWLYCDFFIFQRYCEVDNYRLVVEENHVDEKKKQDLDQVAQ